MEVSVQGWELGVIHLESQRLPGGDVTNFCILEKLLSPSFKITLSDSQHLTSCGTNISSKLLFSLNNFKSMYFQRQTQPSTSGFTSSQWQAKQHTLVIC